MFGLLNIVSRPLGGIISDLSYRQWGLTAKKWWIISLGLTQSAILLGSSILTLSVYPLIVAMTVLGACVEAGNGAIFSLVPSVHPQFHGTVSGVTGACGNIGGILFGFIFLLCGIDYRKALRIIGCFCLLSNLIVTQLRLPATK